MAFILGIVAVAFCIAGVICLVIGIHVAIGVRNREYDYYTSSVDDSECENIDDAIDHKNISSRKYVFCLILLIYKDRGFFRNLRAKILHLHAFDDQGTSWYHDDRTKHAFVLNLEDGVPHIVDLTDRCYSALVKRGIPEDTILFPHMLTNTIHAFWVTKMEKSDTYLSTSSFYFKYHEYAYDLYGTDLIFAQNTRSINVERLLKYYTAYHERMWNTNKKEGENDE